MNWRACAAVLAALSGLLLVGCKSVPKSPATRTVYQSDGDVSAQRMLAPASESYQADSGARYSGSSPVQGNATPQYPAALLSSRLPPVSVTVRVIVDISGAVTDASVTGVDKTQSDFGEAALAAVRSWRFTPLKRTTEGGVESLPFSQQYKFFFTQVNGRAVVQSAGAASR